MGFLVRSTGIVAAVLAVAALAWGFFFSARATGKKLRPAWWLDLHNGLGGLAMIFTSLHVGLSVLDSGAGIGMGQALVPGTAADDRLGIGVGVVAFYLFGLAVFTTWPRKLRDRRVWHIVHLGSVVGVALALWHSYLSGTDGGRVSMQVGIVACVALATYSLGLRLFGWLGRRSHGLEDSQPAPS